jgi:hypothetical protein
LLLPKIEAAVKPIAVPVEIFRFHYYDYDYVLHGEFRAKSVIRSLEQASDANGLRIGSNQPRPIVWITDNIQPHWYSFFLTNFKLKHFLPHDICFLRSAVPVSLAGIPASVS